jgi:hypothetical protein
MFLDPPPSLVVRVHNPLCTGGRVYKHNDLLPRQQSRLI